MMVLMLIVRVAVVPFNADDAVVMVKVMMGVIGKMMMLVMLVVLVNARLMVMIVMLGLLVMMAMLTVSVMVAIVVMMVPAWTHPTRAHNPL